MGFSECRVSTNGIEINYLRSGGNKRPLVFAHGVSGSGPGWLELGRVLEDSYDCILVDLRGHGLSDKPKTGYTRQEVANDLEGLIRALGIGPVSLLGHSWGAACIPVLAAQHPDLVRSMVLEDPGWLMDDSPTAKRATDKDWTTEIAARKALSLDELIAANRRENPNWSEEAVRQCALSFQHFSEDVAEVVGSPRRHWREVVPEVSCPTLLLTASPEKGAWVTSEVADEICRLNAHVQREHFPEAGHCIRREQPQAFLSAVTPFLSAPTPERGR